MAKTLPFSAYVPGVGRSRHATLDAAKRAAKRSASQAARHSGGPAPLWCIEPTESTDTAAGCVVWLEIRGIDALALDDGRVLITDSGAYDPIPTPKGWSHDGADDSGEYIAR